MECKHMFHTSFILWFINFRLDIIMKWLYPCLFSRCASLSMIEITGKKIVCMNYNELQTTGYV